MKKILVIMILLSNMVYSQQVLQLKSDSLKVIDATGFPKNESVNTSFVFNGNSMMINSDDKRIHSFLVPGSEFMGYEMIIFTDSGYTIDMDDSTGTFTDTNAVKPNLGVLYQSVYPEYPAQIIQVVSDSTITLIKRDRTFIVFNIKQ